MKKYSFVFFVLLIACSYSMISCQKDLPPNGDLLGYDYYPLNIGVYTISNVQKEEYTIDSPDPKFSEYQLKEVVSDTFTDLSQRKSFVIERYIRATPQDSWEIDSVWAATNTRHQLIRTENNINYIKLAFPLDHDLSWNGNSLNTQPEWTFKIQNLRQPMEINDLSFEKSLKVLQIDDSTLINRTKFEEYYAQGVGIIKVNKTNVRYMSDGEDLGLGKIQSGYIYNQHIIAYGQNSNE